MGLWLSLAFAFFLQEGVSTTVILSAAYRVHLSPWGIHLLWLVIVSLETLALYMGARYLKKRASGSRVDRWIHRCEVMFEQTVGTYGERIALAGVAFFFSPGLAALLAAWFDIPLWVAFVIIVVSDFLWYLSEWLTVVGISSFALRVPEAIFVAVVAGLVISLALHIVRKRFNK
jgi:hypothetical protein